MIVYAIIPHSGGIAEEGFATTNEEEYDQKANEWVNGYYQDPDADGVYGLRITLVDGEVTGYKLDDLGPHEEEKPHPGDCPRCGTPLYTLKVADRGPKGSRYFQVYWDEPGVYSSIAMGGLTLATYHTRLPEQTAPIQEVTEVCCPTCLARFADTSWTYDGIEVELRPSDTTVD